MCGFCSNCEARAGFAARSTLQVPCRWWLEDNCIWTHNATCKQRRIGVDCQVEHLASNAPCRIDLYKEFDHGRTIESLAARRSPLAARLILLIIPWALVSTSAAGQASCPPQFTGMPNARPDADIAVGRTHVLISDHDHIKVFSKCGTQLPFVLPPGPVAPILPNGLPLNGTENGVNSFFFTAAPFCEVSGEVLGDERVIHDPVSNRFVAMAAGKATEGVVIAVSDPNDATRWPTITRRLLVVGCPPLDGVPLHIGSISTSGTSSLNRLWFLGEISSGTTCGPQTQWVIGKFDLPGVGAASWYQEPGGIPNGYFLYTPTLAVRQTMDSAPQYAIGFDKGVSGLAPALRVLALNVDPNGNIPPPWEVSLTVNPGDTPPATMPQPGAGSPAIKTSPSDVIWKAVYRDGFVWAVHCLGKANTFSNASSHNVVRWYKINMHNWNGPGTATPMIEESGELSPSQDANCWVPSVAVAANGMAAISYNAVDVDVPIVYNPSIFTHIKCNHLTAFNSAVLRYTHPTPIVQSPAPLHNTDYSGTVIDPVIPARFWLHHALTGGSPSVASIVHRFEECGADFLEAIRKPA